MYSAFGGEMGTSYGLFLYYNELYLRRVSSVKGCADGINTSQQQVADPLGSLVAPGLKCSVLDYINFS